MSYIALANFEHDHLPFFYVHNVWMILVETDCTEQATMFFVLLLLISFYIYCLMQDQRKASYLVEVAFLLKVIYLSICLSIYLFIYLSICLSIHLSTYLSSYLSI